MKMHAGDQDKANYELASTIWVKFATMAFGRGRRTAWAKRVTAGIWVTHLGRQFREGNRSGERRARRNQPISSALN